VKNVLILGATSELAQAIARKYADENWSLTLAALESDQLGALVKHLSICSDAQVHGLFFDATDYPGHRSFYDSLPVQPDVVVCAFAYLGDQTQARFDFQEVHRTIGVNLLGAMSILNIVAEDFEKRGHGTIAGISSVAGERGRQGNYTYGSSKAGFTAYLSGLRARLASSGVHVMTVVLGFCRTKMTESINVPCALTAEPEQVANAVFRGLQRKRNMVYSVWAWRWIMMLVRNAPEVVFQRLAYSRFHY
jgi:decaprenylphospho-beta-D-erythro-pentofuranosid-2-ulose 2-reductase